MAVPALGLFGTAPARADPSILYVDRGNPNCSNAGPGTQAQPFCAIDRGASVAIAGQTVQVASGVYTENVFVDNSGAPGSPIVFKPAPGATVTVRGKAHGFEVERSWITVRGFIVADTTGAGIDVAGASNVTVEGNTVSGSGEPTSTGKAVGIKLASTTDSTVSKNVVHHNSDRGIYLNESSGILVSGNVTYENARQYEREASGIHVYRSTSNTVVGNISHDNEDSGINIYTYSTDNLVVNNVSYENGDHGIDNYKSTGTRLIGNTVYDNVTAGINAEGGSTGVTFANNISVDNGIASPRTHGNLRVDSASDSGSSINDDLVYLSTPDIMVIWDGVGYSSLAALRAATGQEARGIQADPRWRNRGAGDFHLLTGSPAIDSANSGASGQSATDLEGRARVDDAGTPNTGVGPRAYDDRGAYEFTPGPPPPNNPPIAVDDIATTSQDTPVVVSVLANDTDPDGDPLSVTAVGSPAHGTAAPNPNGTVTYTPASGYTGPDSFSYTAGDGRGGSDTASVSVTVAGPPPQNNPPNAVDDTATTSQDTPVVVSVLANDTDPDGDPLSVTAVGSPAHGTAAANPNGTVTYTPASGYTGPDSFTYTAGDGRGGSDTATVSLTVTVSNLVSNPDFETNLNGWNTSGSGAGVTLARVAGGHSGGWAAQVSNTGSSTVTCTLNDAPNWVPTTAAGTYTATMWVRSDTAGATFKLRFREYAGSTLAGTQQTAVTLTTGWQEVTLTYAPAAPGSSTLDLNGFAPVGPGTCFYADDISITRA